MGHEAARAALTGFLSASGDRGKASSRADALLARFGSLGAVLAAQPEALMHVVGVDRGVADVIYSAQSLLLASLRHQLLSAPVFADGSILIEYLRAQLAHEKREIVRVLHLDGRLCLLADDLLAVGTLHAAAVPCREIVRRALEVGSGSVILVHNHPSGDCRPSREDVALTKRLAALSRGLELTLADHIIIARSGFTSMRAEGLM